MAMWALAVATIYFGSFLALGVAARILLGKVMQQHGADLADVQAQAGTNRRKRKVFLLGVWREEG
jgi:hypothetical protein